MDFTVAKFCGCKVICLPFISNPGINARATDFINARATDFLNNPYFKDRHYLLLTTYYLLLSTYYLLPTTFSTKKPAAVARPTFFCGYPHRILLAGAHLHHAFFDVFITIGFIISIAKFFSQHLGLCVVGLLVGPGIFGFQYFGGYSRA